MARKLKKGDCKCGLLFSNMFSVGYKKEFIVFCDTDNYLVTISTGTLKIFATFRIVSMCLPVAAAM